MTRVGSYAYCSEVKAVTFDWTCCESCHVDHEEYGYNLCEQYPPMENPVVDLVAFTCCGAPRITERGWLILIENASKELWERAFNMPTTP